MSCLLYFFLLKMASKFHRSKTYQGNWPHSEGLFQKSLNEIVQEKKRPQESQDNPSPKVLLSRISFGIYDRETLRLKQPPFGRVIGLKGHIKIKPYGDPDKQGFEGAKIGAVSKGNQKAEDHDMNKSLEVFPVT